MKVKLDKQGGEEGQTIVFYGTTDPEIVTEKIRLAEKAEAAEEPGQVIVKTRKDMKEGERWVSAPAKEAKVVEGQPYAWTIQEGGHAVVGKAGTAVWVAEGGPAYAYATGMRDEEMLKRVQALQEQVQAIKAKKMDLSALEESLKKLEAELQAKEEKLKEIKSKLERVPGEPVLIKKVRETEAEGGDTFVITEDKAVRPAKGGVFVATGDKNEGTINLVFTGHEGEAGQGGFRAGRHDAEEGAAGRLQARRTEIRQRRRHDDLQGRPARGQEDGRAVHQKARRNGPGTDQEVDSVPLSGLAQGIA